MSGLHLILEDRRCDEHADARLAERKHERELPSNSPTKFGRSRCWLNQRTSLPRIVCYNITLVNYIRRLLADKHVPLGKDGVEVCHFFQLCAKITGEDIPYEKADSEYYEMIIQDTLEKLPSCNLRYDAILIDEGQDFSDEMLKIVTALLNPLTDHLAIALDDNQNIYQRRSSWKEVGIHARGRVHRLSWIYRNTEEIADFARRIIEGGQESHREGHQAELFPEIFEAMHGPQPDVRSV